MATKNYTKTKRAFTPLRKYAWLFTLLVAIGGLWEPRLGLLVIAVMAALTITALFKGRYWCGNVCPFQLAPYNNFDSHRKFRDINCIKCGVCTENCPLELLSLA